MSKVCPKPECPRLPKSLAAYNFCLITFFGMSFVAMSSAMAQHSTQQSPATVFRQTHSSVVLIVGAGGDEVAQGSGFIIAKDRVVTNYHVIEGLSEAYVRFADGRTESVQGVVSADKSQDIAVLEVQTSGRSSLPFGDDIALREGDPVLALGAPRGLELTLTNGIVSAFRKSGGQFLIQNTAPIAPGSSGGPLLNLSGQVIGITSMQLTNTPGVYFSIGISQVRTLLKAAATASQPFAQWASGKSVGASPSLSETFAWIKGKVEAKAGGKWTTRDAFCTKDDVDDGDIHLLQSENECVFVISGRSSTLTDLSRCYQGNSFAGCDETITDRVSHSLPMYDLKEASVILLPEGTPAVDLQFSGNSVSNHNQREDTIKGCNDPSKNKQSLDAPYVFHNNFEVIRLYKFPSEDNEALAKRLADAFNHAAEICAGRKPKSNEPF